MKPLMNRLVSATLLLLVLPLPALATEPADFAGNWTCNWSGRVDVDMTINVGAKIDITYAWPVSALWGTREAGEITTEGKIDKYGELEFSFQYLANPRVDPSISPINTITLEHDKDDTLVGKHQSRLGMYTGTCKKK